MKTLKSKFLLPVAIFMVAVVAAFAAQSTNGDDLALEQGYIHGTTPCEVAIECSPILGKVCTYKNQQVFGMNSASQCSRTLYLPN